jgi:D-amino peptidase
MRFAIILALIAALAPSSSDAQQRQRLKVYISVDMEGIAGLTASSQTSSTGSDYGWARRLMIEETNAAIGAAFEAGATEVLVNDSHGSQTNLLPDQIDRRAALITGQPKPLGMAQGIDSTFDAAVYIGYHAHGSEAQSILGHTFNGNLKHVRLNGTEVGEYGLNGAVAGHFGVPVVFVSGDRAFVEEAKAFFPGVEALSVKEAIAFTAARTMHPLEAREKIAAGVKAGLAKRATLKPLRLTSPITLEIELASLAQADAAVVVPGVKRVSGRVVSYTANDMPTVYRMARVIMALSSLQ